MCEDVKVLGDQHASIATIFRPLSSAEVRQLAYERSVVVSRRSVDLPVIDKVPAHMQARCNTMRSAVIDCAEVHRGCCTR